MEKPKVLFVCSVLGARSQIACYFLNRLCEGKINAVAAGFESGTLGKKILAFLAAQKIQIPSESPRTVFERYRDQEKYDYVVLLCNDAAREQCPIFTRSVNTLYEAQAKQVQWHIPDFKSVEGTEEFILEQWQLIVDELKQQVSIFVAEELSL